MLHPWAVSRNSGANESQGEVQGNQRILRAMKQELGGRAPSSLGMMVTVSPLSSFISHYTMVDLW